MAYLTEEQVKLFRSDFRIVADYFVQKRKNKNYIPSRRTIKHVDAVLRFMSVMTGDEQFLEAKKVKKWGGKKRTRSWIEWNLQNYQEYGFGLWAVVRKETSELIGDCGLTIQNIDGEMLPDKKGE